MVDRRRRVEKQPEIKTCARSQAVDEHRKIAAMGEAGDTTSKVDESKAAVDLCSTTAATIEPTMGSSRGSAIPTSKNWGSYWLSDDGRVVLVASKVPRAAYPYHDHSYSLSRLEPPTRAMGHREQLRNDVRMDNKGDASSKTAEIKALCAKPQNSVVIRVSVPGPSGTDDNFDGLDDIEPNEDDCHRRASGDDHSQAYKTALIAAKAAFAAWKNRIASSVNAGAASRSEEMAVCAEPRSSSVFRASRDCVLIHGSQDIAGVPTAQDTVAVSKSQDSVVIPTFQNTALPVFQDTATIHTSQDIAVIPASQDFAAYMPQDTAAIHTSHHAVVIHTSQDSSVVIRSRSSMSSVDVDSDDEIETLSATSEPSMPDACL